MDSRPIALATLFTVCACSGSPETDMIVGEPPGVPPVAGIVGRSSAEAPGQAPPASDACEAASEALGRRHVELRACSSDDECNYVILFYEIVPRERTDAFVTSFDCRVKSPLLVVANAELLRAAIENGLLEEQASQTEACVPEGGEFTCQAFGGFVSTQPPVCREGTCVRTVPEDATEFVQ